MKISDLLGEGWESDERSDAPAEPRAAGYAAAAQPPSVVSVPPTVSDPAATEAPGARTPDVIASLASWSPAPEPRAPTVPTQPVSARAQLADLAAGLAAPVAPPAEVEPVEAPPDELAGLDLVVDDLLPGATKAKGSGRGSSRSGSRRRGR